MHEFIWQLGFKILGSLDHVESKILHHPNGEGSTNLHFMSMPYFYSQLVNHEHPPLTYHLLLNSINSLTHFNANKHVNG